MESCVPCDRASTRIFVSSTLRVNAYACTQIFWHSRPPAQLFFVSSCLFRLRFVCGLTDWLINKNDSSHRWITFFFALRHGLRTISKVNRQSIHSGRFQLSRSQATKIKRKRRMFEITIKINATNKFQMKFLYFSSLVLSVSLSLSLCALAHFER